MVESTCFQHTSSHPDKHNNSVDRIISKEEEREDPRRDSSIYLRVQWCFHIPTRTTVFPHAIQQLQVILHTELILLQEILQLQGSSRAGSFQYLFPVHPSILHGRIRLPAPLQHSRATQHKQASSNSTRQKQHSTWQPCPRSPYSSSQAHSYRILPGEIPLQRVKYCMSMQY